MSQRTVCDGCEAVLWESHGGAGGTVVVQGERANGLKGGGDLPDGRFDWCEACAQIGFAAVRVARDLAQRAGRTS